MFASQDAAGQCIVAIVGDSTKGKTELAKKYMLENRGKYYHIWFVPAENWEESYRKLALKWKLVSEDKVFTHDINLVIDRVHSIFSQKRFCNSPSLIVFDNVPKNFMIKIFQGGVPQNTHILITSQKDTHQYQIDLGVDKECFLTDQEGMQLFQNRMDISVSDRPYVKEIVEKFRELPVVLVQAAHFLEKNPLKFSSYLKIFNEDKKNVLKSGALQNPQNEKTINTYVSIRMNIQALEQESPSAVDFLYKCTYLPPDSIPLRLLHDLYNTEDLGSILEAIKPLLTLSNTDKTVSMNETIQDLIQATLSEKPKEKTLLEIAKYADKYEQFLLTNPKKAIEIFEFGVNNAASLGLDEAKLFTFLLATGKSYDRYFRAIDAMHYYERAEKMNDRLKILQGNELINFYHRLASCYNRNKDFSNADAINKEGLKLAKLGQLQNKNLSIAKFLYGLGVAICGKANNQEENKTKKNEMIREGINLMKQALKMVSEDNSSIDFDDQNYTKAAIFQSLGWQYGNIKNYTEAESCYKEALKIRKKGSICAATTQSSLAWIYIKQDEFGKALNCEIEALKIRMNILGPKHDYVAASKRNLSIIYYDNAKKNKDKKNNLELSIENLKDVWEINKFNGTLLSHEPDLFDKMFDCLLLLDSLQEKKQFFLEILEMIKNDINKEKRKKILDRVKEKVGNSDDKTNKILFDDTTSKKFESLY